jgi:hypothetical protein
LSVAGRYSCDDDAACHWQRGNRARDQQAPIDRLVAVPKKRPIGKQELAELGCE